MRGAPDSHASHVYKRGGREESGRGRERERTCRCLCREEGAHAQFARKKAVLNHAPCVAT